MALELSGVGTYCIKRELKKTFINSIVSYLGLFGKLTSLSCLVIQSSPTTVLWPSGNSVKAF